MQSSNIAVLENIDSVLFGGELFTYQTYQRKSNDEFGWALGRSAWLKLLLQYYKLYFWQAMPNSNIAVLQENSIPGSLLCNSLTL